MTDSVKSAAEAAAREAAERFDTGTRERPLPMNAARQSAFVSGAAWQREQDESVIERAANDFEKAWLADEVSESRARIAELEAEVKRLRAQVASFGRIYPGTYATKEQRPDDTEVDEDIAQAESFADAVWDISEKYGADVTGNMERWQNGKFLREVGDFIEDVKKVSERFLVKPVEAERDELAAKLAKIRAYADALIVENDNAGPTYAEGFLAILDGEEE